MRETVVLFRMREQHPEEALLLTLDLSQEDDNWVGTCLELGTSAFSHTLDQSTRELIDAIELQLEEIERLGFLDDFLRDHGVVPLRVPPHGTLPSSRWAAAVQRSA